MKIQITKCYLVQLLDNEGNELQCEYVFGDRQDALRTGQAMKESLRREETANENSL